MENKPWKSYDMVVNGLPQRVRYNEETVQGLFLPLLQKLTALQRREMRRIIAFLAAPPATGKSTLLQFLEQLSREREGIREIQALGMDGFHYPNKYLEEHFLDRAGERISLKSIKGAPETFDAQGLREKIRAAKKGDVSWPVYDRKIHDVLFDALAVTGDILLLEGNWLLLDEPEWRELHCLADYTLCIQVAPELLKDRLIKRKIQGGLTESEAISFYEASDRRNVERLTGNTVPADEVWRMEEDGDFAKGSLAIGSSIV